MKTARYLPSIQLNRCWSVSEYFVCSTLVLLQITIAHCIRYTSLSSRNNCLSDARCCSSRSRDRQSRGTGTGQQHRPIAVTLWESTIYGWSTTHFKWPLWKQCTVSVTPSIVQKYRLYSYTKQVGKQRTWSIAYMITTLYAPQASERQVTIVIRQTAAQFHDIVDNA